MKKNVKKPKLVCTNDSTYDSDVMLPSNIKMHQFGIFNEWCSQVYMIDFKIYHQ